MNIFCQFLFTLIVPKQQVKNPPNLLQNWSSLMFRFWSAMASEARMNRPEASFLGSCTAINWSANTQIACANDPGMSCCSPLLARYTRHDGVSEAAIFLPSLYLYVSGIVKKKSFLLKLLKIKEIYKKKTTTPVKGHRVSALSRL